MFAPTKPTDLDEQIKKTIKTTSFARRHSILSDFRHIIFLVKNGSIPVYKRMKYYKLYIAGKLRRCTI